MGDRIEQGTEKAQHIDPDALTVCIEHGAFVPCRRNGFHYETQNPYWVKAVRDYQSSTVEGLTWEPASDYAARRVSENPTPPEPKARSLTVWCSSCLPGRPCFVHEEDGGYPPPSDNPSSPGDEWGDADRPLTDVKVRPVMDEEWQESHDLDPSGFDTSPAAGEG